MSDNIVLGARAFFPKVGKSDKGYFNYAENVEFRQLQTNFQSKMRAILLVLTIAFFTTGCKKNNDLTGKTDQTIVVDGRTREYIQYLPEDWEEQAALPIVFVLHGGNVGTPENTIKGIDFRDLSEEDKFILIYPAGIDKNWNDGRPTDANLQGVDDVNFFRKLIEKLVANFDVDENAVFVTGISNGGFMSSRLGCELGDKIVAFAAVAATIEANSVFTACAPTTPVSAMYIHGTSDPIVSINGGEMTSGDGGFIVSHADAINKWVQLNNTSVIPVVTNFPDIANDGTTIVRFLYENGSDGSEVVSYVIENGGHTWPQASGLQLQFIVGITSQDMKATQVVWDFFKSHKRI